MFTTLDTFDTEYSADSVEWCPAEGFQDLFVCGTYQLIAGEENQSRTSQERVGRIYLFQVTKSGLLRLAQTLDTAGILDMKWSHVNVQGEPLLAAVNSIGYLQIYRLRRENEPTLELKMEIRVNEKEKEILALSLDWNTGRGICNKNVQISVSDSAGSISLFSYEEEKLELRTIKKIHDFEAWITGFDYWDPNTVYSGGDDCKFYRLDARLDLALIGSSKRHELGVTSIHSNSAKEFSLATGSYDETLRIWDTRNFRTPVSETNLGGGIWRLKWNNRENLLAACMYGGFRIVNCLEESKPQIIDEYRHESIAYGCDWSFLKNSVIKSTILENCSEKTRLVATCSFYDHTLKLSSLEIENS